MKRICEFCKKEYDWVEGQPKWVKPNSDMKPTDRNAMRSDKFCCYECGTKSRTRKIQETNLKKYGRANAGQFGSIEHSESMLKKYNTKFPMCNETIKNKTKQKVIDKYGVDNISKLKQVKDKKRETFEKNYVGGHPLRDLIVIQKLKNTKKERYGDENFNNRGKCKKTKQEKYGDENYNNSEKCGQTKEERYGNKNYNNIEKAKKTNQKRYGGNCSMCSKEVREKSKQTTKEKYGVEYVSQSPEIRQKVYNTKKKNHTFNTSKPEKEIEKLLLEKFPDTKNQYKSELYPFACDFYIPSLDLYIEFQGFWVHGKEPYNENKEEHIILLEEWENRSKDKLQYKRAINTWTIKDPLKRKTAKDNNLNWIEFFTFEDFLEWYEKQ